MGKRAPAAPDPYATAQAQMQVNRDAAGYQQDLNTRTAQQTANLNRTNTIGPGGSVTWQSSVPDRSTWMAQDRAEAERQGKQIFNSEAEARAAGSQNYWTPEGASTFYDRTVAPEARWTATTTLSPEQQELYNQGVELARRTGQIALNQIPRLEGIINSPIETGDLAGWQRDDADARDRATAGILSRLEPQFQRDREGLEGRLISQGFTPGSEAYNRAADELNRSMTDARMQAVTAGLNESRAAAGFNNNLRGAQLAERLQLRAQPINEIAALFGLGPGLQTPQQIQGAPVNVAGAGLNATDLAGLIQQNYATRAQQQQANNANWFGLAGAGLGAAGSAFGGWLRRPPAAGG